MRVALNILEKLFTGGRRNFGPFPADIWADFSATTNPGDVQLFYTRRDTLKRFKLYGCIRNENH